MNKNIKKSLYTILTGADLGTVLYLIAFYSVANVNVPQDKSKELENARMYLAYLQDQFALQQEKSVKEAADFAEYSDLLQEKRNQMYDIEKNMQKANSEKYTDAQNKLNQMNEEFAKVKDSLMNEYISNDKTLEIATKNMQNQENYINQLKQDSAKSEKILQTSPKQRAQENYKLMQRKMHEKFINIHKKKLNELSR